MIDKILEFFKTPTLVGKVNRKLYGEVLTPISLVNEMLDGLPSEVWCNPSLTWLDPANGRGVFPAVVLQRLMIGLEQWQADEEKRYKHIMEKMIYVCELQPENVVEYVNIFDPQGKYKFNTFTGSFLTPEFDQHSQEIWGVEKFDVIVGNPPYQLQKEGFKKTQPLWDKFVTQSLKTLTLNGYLCMVHPSGWRNIGGIFTQIKESILERNLLHLKIRSAQEGLRRFGAATRFDFYTLENKKPNGKTEITFQDGVTKTIDLKKLQLIPNEQIERVMTLLNGNQKIIYSRSLYGSDKKHMSKEKTGEFKFPCAYYTGAKNRIDLLYSSKKSEHFGEPKVIITQNVWGGRAFPDPNGEFGLTQFVFGISCQPEDANDIALAINSTSFRDIICKLHMSKCGYEKAIFSLLNKDFWKEFI